MMVAYEKRAEAPVGDEKSNPDGNSGAETGVKASAPARGGKKKKSGAPVKQESDDGDVFAEPDLPPMLPGATGFDTAHDEEEARK